MWPWRQKRENTDAARLLAVVTQISRQPAFFGEGRVSDTLEGRLEVMTLHAALAMIRIGRDRAAAPLSQAFADALFKQFDDGLREAGVGDTAVPKRMHKIAGQFYGRLDAYAGALEMGDPGALEAAIARNVFQQPQAPFAQVLARHAVATAEQQGAAPVEALLRLDGWRPAPL